MANKPNLILVVEDDPAIQQLVSTVLRKRGAAVDIACDGAEAIALVRSKQYDTVVLDIMLPRANGFEVAAALDELPLRPRLVVLSAVARYFRDRFPEGTVMLQKPFNLDQLAAAVSAP